MQPRTRGSRDDMSRTLKSSIIAALTVPLGAALLLTGCTGGGLDERARADAELRTEAVAAWRYEARPVGSGPTLIDGVVLAYVLGSDDRLELRAIDALDGSELWASEASTGSIGREVPISPMVVRDADGAPFALMVRRPLAGDGEYNHRLLMRDLRTGEVVVESEAMWVDDPRSCRTTNVGVCYTSFVRDLDGDGRVDAEGYRFNPETGVAEPFDDRLPGFERQLRLASGLYVVEEAGEEVLVSLDDHDIDTQDRDLVDAPQWRTPIEELVDTETSILGSLHELQRDDETATALLKLQQVDGVGDERAVVAGTEQVIAINLDSGQLRWRRDGVDLCGWAVLCSGERSLSPNPERSTSGMGYWDSERGATRLERVDPATGDEQWSLEVADLGGDAADDSPQLMAVEGYRVISDTGVPLLIDLETGRSRELRADEVAGCSSEVSFTAHEYSNPSRDMVEYTSGAVIAACDASGEIDAPLSIAAVRSAAPSWGERDEALLAEHEDGPGAEDDLEIDLDETRWRVVQTASAIVGYHF